MNPLFVRGNNFLQTTLPILGGAMTWVSEANLVASISNAGAFGVLASGSMNKEQLQKEIKKTKTLTDRQFGVNIILLNPALDQLIEACIEESVSHVVLAGGIASKPIISKLKSRGVKVICFAPTLGVAKRLAKIDVDALILEGMEAGGHVGPVSTSVLAQEILLEMRNILPVFMAGGIGHGEMIMSYMRMGAAGCQIGTLFACATESIAHPKFKKAYIEANSRDAVVSNSLTQEFHVIPVRALANKGTAQFNQLQQQVLERYQKELLTKDEAQLEIEKFWAGALRRAVIEGDVEYGSLMAGQAVGLVNQERPVAEILHELKRQMELDTLTIENRLKTLIN